MGFEIYDGWLPEGYQFPPEFVAAVEADIDILPWRFFAIDNWYDARDWFDIFAEEYPPGVFIPFAYLYDPTGWSEEYPLVAAFDAADNSIRDYDFEPPNSVGRPPVPDDAQGKPSFTTFDQWLEIRGRQAQMYRGGFEPDRLKGWLEEFKRHD